MSLDIEKLENEICETAEEIRKMLEVVSDHDFFQSHIDSLEELCFDIDHYNSFYETIDAVENHLRIMKQKVRHHMIRCQLRKIISNFVFESNRGFEFKNIAAITGVTEDDARELIGEEHTMDEDNCRQERIENLEEELKELRNE